MGINRREFLQSGTALVAGISATALDSAAVSKAYTGSFPFTGRLGRVIVDIEV